ncbi:MAG TPA: hypothetical protein VGC19_16070 [Rhodanobacter sp.]
MSSRFPEILHEDAPTFCGLDLELDHIGSIVAIHFQNECCAQSGQLQPGWMQRQGVCGGQEEMRLLPSVVMPSLARRSQRWISAMLK